MKHPFNKDLQMAGKECVWGFLSRYQNLSLRVAEALSYAREKGMCKEKVSVFYNLCKLLDQQNLWDEPETVISVRRKRDVVRQTNCEKGEMVSVMACVSATGQ